jgi:hypothetical protein
MADDCKNLENRGENREQTKRAHSPLFGPIPYGDAISARLQRLTVGQHFAQQTQGALVYPNPNGFSGLSSGSLLPRYIRIPGSVFRTVRMGESNIPEGPSPATKRHFPWLAANLALRRRYVPASHESTRSMLPANVVESWFTSNYSLALIHFIKYG